MRPPLLFGTLGVAMIATFANAQITFVDTGIIANDALSMGINNSGQIYSNSASGQIFREPDGTTFTIAPPPGFGGATFWSMNNSGAVGGEATAGGGITRAIIRNHDGTFVIPIPTGNTRGSGINDSGDAVGWIPDAHDTPFIYHQSDTSVTPLPEPAGAIGSNAYNMNNNDGVTGIAVYAGGPFRAWRYSPGNGIEVIPLPASVGSEPTDINNSGVVVGTSGSLTPFRWNADGTVTQFAGAGVAYGINDLNETVGGVLSGLPRAMYWGPDNTTIDLNTLLTPAQQFNYFLTVAFEINDGSTIVGSARFDPDGPGGPNTYSNHVFLMTIPEPSFAGVFPVVAISLTRFRACKRRT